VYAWMVVMRPRSMPSVSLSTLTIGARQLVVHEAMEMMWCAAGSYRSWLTPSTRVTSSFFAGAEMITFLAPPSRCARALVASVNSPVDSITMSAPTSPHGSFAGSRSLNARTTLPATVISPPSAFTSYGSRPRMLSYLSRWAMVAGSPRSLNATTSTSASDSSSARKKLRPMRPRPLMPTRIVTGLISQDSYCAHRPPPAAGVSPALSPSLSTLAGRSARRHLRGDTGVGVRYAELARPLVRQRQQPPDAAGDGVLGQRRVGQPPELLQRGLAVLQPQLAGGGQVRGRVVAEDLQRPGDPGGGGHGRARR